LYAVLGFPAFTNANLHVVPDYTKSVADIFIEIVELTINALQNLDVLSYVYHPTSSSLNDRAFPSWASRWTESPEVIANTRIAFAGGDTKIKFTREGDAHSLMLAGFSFDSVATLITSKDTSGWFQKRQSLDVGRQYSLYQHPLRSWNSAKDPFKDVPNEDSPFIFALTLTAGLSFDGLAAKNNMTTFKSDSTAYMDSLFPRDPDLTGSSWLMEGTTTSRKGSAERFRFSAHRMAQNRVLFRTAKGYVGLGPLVTRPNDIVCLLFGGNVPYILRPMGKYYKLVGECYVYGIMDGEAINEWRVKGEKEEIFELR